MTTSPIDLDLSGEEDEVEFGKWFGGVMSANTGAHDPIARNTMAASVVTHTRTACKCEKVDIIMIGVPAGTGDAFMAKFVEAVGGDNPNARGEVVL